MCVYQSFPLLKLKIISTKIIIIVICLGMCEFMQDPTEGVSDPLGLELYAIIGLLTWIPGIEPWSSAIAGSSFNH